MILPTRKYLENHILIFVMVLQILFSQMPVSTGFIVPQTISKAESDISTETYSQQDVDTTNRKICILEKVFGDSKSPNLQCDDLSLISLSEIIKEAYHYSNDELENIDQILKFIERQPTKDIKDLAYNVLYQAVLDHYMLEKLETTRTNLCLLEIIIGKKQEAIGHFEEMNPTSVAQLVEYAINFNDTILPQFGDFLHFIVHKPEISNIEHNILIISLEIGYEKAIKKWGPSILTFAAINLIEVGVKLRSTKIESFYFNKLQKLWAKIIVTYCGFLKQHDHVIFKNLKDYSSHLPEMSDKIKKFENYFLDILLPSVRRVLNKEGVENNVDMFLKCVPITIPVIEPGAILYSTIFDEMAKQNLLYTNNFITRFAYYIKNYMEAPNYSHILEQFKEVFEDLKNNIPHWAQKLIWSGDKCKLENRKWDQYLSACGELGCNTTSVDGHVVFSSQIDALQDSTEVQSQWKFETNNQGTSFTIKNVASGEYLYPGSNLADEKSHPVFTSNSEIPNIESLWNITAPSNGSFITLQNTHNNEYLYVGGLYESDQLKRKVFTQRSGSPTQAMPRENEWKLIC
ncbi:uncharacterized protein LOC123297310 [Chrysoperla carnea]|uniref:uncharacterized protein LOC123297310 n=1 Tax=Chrysoperla carnea TaxID=189513 RepID=UPI001D07B200|nr:uncharacterized protein LOC123297310 [Chrysoperla carnea]XP_044734855.1 uncharacterized protein LOC123297310 [Chrysoperla carnea]